MCFPKEPANYDTYYLSRRDSLIVNCQLSTKEQLTTLLGIAPYGGMSCYPIYLGSQVRFTPSRLNVLSSTEDRITEECTSQPRSLSSCSMAYSAMGLVAALMDRAIRVSSVWSLGFRLPRWSIFRC